MNKILKKIGVIGIICAILSPFVSLPKVNADDGCKNYLHQYMFLDVTTGNSWEQYSSNKGYKTYTSFLYTFPVVSEGQTIDVTSVEELYLIDLDNEMLEEYRTNLLNAIDEETGEVDDDFSNLNKMGTSYDYSGDDDVTTSVILHGYWALPKKNYKKTDYEKILKGIKSEKDFRNHTIQGAIIKSDLLDDDEKENFNLGVKFYGAKYSATADNFTSVSDSFSTFIEDVVVGINAADSNNKVLTNDYVYSPSDGVYYINMGIKRTISDDDLNLLTFGAENVDANETGNGTYYVYSTKKVDDVKDVEDSYSAFMNYIDANKNETVRSNAFDLDTTDENYGNFCQGTGDDACYRIEVSEDEIDINLSTYYYWPAVLNVEYKICTTSNTEEPTNPGDGGSQTPVEKWTLKYNANAENVANMPDNQVDITAANATVSDKKPTRNGYAFNGWNTKSDGSGQAYKAGDSVAKDKNGVTLYAQWGKEGSEENKKQGVISYVIGFAAVGLVAGGIYLVSKKKNLFKQI